MSGNEPFMRAFRDLIDDSFRNYMNLSSKIGELVKQQSLMVEGAINEQYKFLGLTCLHSQPTQDVLVSLLKPTSDHIIAIQDFRQKNRATQWFDHLSAISESITALGWVTVAPTPGPFVKEMTDASQFYTNKVLVAFKEKDKTHIEWANSWIKFLTDLQKYIKMYHTTGLTWNSHGQPLTGSSVIAPPPPPPPPASDFLLDNNCQSDARTALLKDLNKGSDITKGLKKITPDLQTHKNPALRIQGPMPYKPFQQPTQVKSMSTPIKPKFELDGRKWVVEHQVGQNELIIQNTEMSQSVNIYKCKDSLIIIKGKINSITLDSCVKTSIVFDDIVSVVELVNCQNIKAQSMGVVPTINVEKTDVVEIYLNPKSLTAEIVTAKSSSINVSVPCDGPVMDYVEHAIPEQFKSVWTGKGFKTLPADTAA